MREQPEYSRMSFWCMRNVNFSQGVGSGAQTCDTKVPANPRQVRYNPDLAIVSAVGSIVKSIVFSLMHTALPSRSAYECGDKYNKEGSSFHS
ncbi:hypothetical protein PoB_003462800 [Plakobranchus ocellatus]|uniref:Uncharacterized protein n=1 Tax=Plakobranchus ocellatus TaxID=259542 RepID=A0AAV4ALE8_9GAST|nr:hypothetical protein PoB_003462800 [Plakobranchus ocellatus]